jgi:hypothetical protein
MRALEQKKEQIIATVRGSVFRLTDIEEEVHV